MTGNKPRRGLADFLSRELKAPHVPVTEEVRHAVTDRVPVREAHQAPRPAALAVAPVAAPAPAPVPAPAVRVAPGSATATQGVAPDSATTTHTREVRKHETPRVPEVETPATAPVAREVTEAGTPEVREVAAAKEAAVTRSEGRSAGVTKSRTSEVDDAEEGEAQDPLYLRLTRKEVRFRDEQMEGLHRLARRLSKARRGMKGDRITDNTLVRVAVDLLLQHADDLAGHDEATLLESLRRLGRKRG